jgi:hypothetical protein
MELKEHSINNLDNFIMGWYIDPSICDAIIAEFNSSPKQKGTVGFGEKTYVDVEIKSCLEVPLWNINNTIEGDYTFMHLQQCVEEYCKKYSFAVGITRWNILECPNIQYYPPNGGFYKWHCERNTYKHPAVNRHLVFMTYLNDVTDDGETEFYYQQIKIKPEKGLTLIWPADWTFTHRGIPSSSQDKYIVTGWYNFTPDNEAQS